MDGHDICNRLQRLGEQIELVPRNGSIPTSGQVCFDAILAIKNLSALIDRIRGALATDETGEAIVEVAAAAHRSEMELATVSKDRDFWKGRATVMYWQKYGKKDV